MPSVPTTTKCQHLGCKQERSKMNSYCIEHGGVDALKRPSDSVYKTAVWQSIRTRQLSLQPLCQACLLRGKVTQANTVDHVFPWQQIGGNSFLRNIFQSLCPECHSVKTGQEQSGKFEHYTDKITVYQKTDYFYEK